LRRTATFLKLQLLQNKALRTIDGLPRRTPTRVLRQIFHVPYVIDYITKICRKQAQVIQTHDNVNDRNVGKVEVQHRKYKRLKFGGSQAYDLSGV
jgi:hypothetical protein